MTMRREKAGGRPKPRGELEPLVSANILESLRKLSLENIGKSFFCVDEAKFKRYVFPVRRAVVPPIPSELYYAIHDIRRQVSFACS